ncbi:hypothetical protein [Pseudoglutamicibacter cumminsii]|uniref:hypothetical protein n=1 Tax=Pseudoglutamicibacter cumminsii TaxID=156979 RepID=UPI00195EB69A|nr:hypothetical protein [Pseudoglutamicibacter cumminsii]MBM7796224.1 peptidoglycan/LPS O-acetylase OafA/YrhL [Pseudoglutamicibacter cumminsii]
MNENNLAPKSTPPTNPASTDTAPTGNVEVPEPRRDTYIGLVVSGVVTSLCMYVPAFLANGDILPRLLLPPLLFGVIGILIAKLSPRKRLGWDVFAGAAIAFVVMVVLMYYFISTSKN